MDTTDQFLVEDDEYVPVGREGKAQGPQETGGSDSGGDGEGGLETDPVRLAQREKQIMYGKNTQAYQNYVRLVPRHKRKLRGKDAHPQTPDINLKASKRCWAGMVRKWRRSLHEFDQPRGEGQSKQPVAQEQQQHQHQQQEEGQRQPHKKQQRQMQTQKQQARQQPHDRQQQRAAPGGDRPPKQAHPYLQPVGQDQVSVPASAPRPRPDSGGWGSASEGQQLASSGATGVRKLTPSKRQHRASPAQAVQDDGSGKWQRDTTSKRVCGQDSKAATAGASRGELPKSWADAVDDAFGDWDD